MTSLLSTTEMTEMRADQAGHYNDTCKILVWSAGTAESYGATPDVYTAGSAMACGVEMTGGKEQTRADGTLTVIDAVVRMPLATIVTVKDRIQITKRHGVTLATALTFSVVGQPKWGPSALVIDLQSVT